MCEGGRVVGCLVDLVALPIVCSLGLCLNLASLVVFLSHPRHPLAPSLSALSMADALQLFFSLLVLYLPALHEYLDSPRYSLFGQLVYLSTGLFEPFLLAVNTASIWIMCYVSIQRYRAICHPLTSLQPSTRAGLHLFLIAVAAVLFNSPKWVENQWEWKLDAETGNRTFLLYNKSPLSGDRHYVLVTDMLLYPLMVYIVPLLLLTVLNMRILLRLASARRLALSVVHRRRNERERRSIHLIIAIVVLFFACHTGGLLIRVVGHRQFEDDAFFVTMKDLINLLFNFNSLANPMVYFFFTRHFKDIRISWVSSSTKRGPPPTGSTDATSCSKQHLNLLSIPASI